MDVEKGAHSGSWGRIMQDAWVAEPCQSRGMSLCRSMRGEWLMGWSAEPAGSPSQPGPVLFAVMCCRRRAHVGSTPQHRLQESLQDGVVSSCAVTQHRPTSIIGLDSMSRGCTLILDGELESSSHPGWRLTGQDACGRFECSQGASTPISTCLPKATTTTLTPDAEKDGCVFRHVSHWLAGVCVENFCVTQYKLAEIIRSSENEALAGTSSHQSWAVPLGR